MTIYLNQILHIENTKDYKVHFARWNKYQQPLEVFTRDKEEWKQWQEYRPKRDEFNRPHIFSLMQYYHEIDTWLFGGIYNVKARHETHYEVELSNHYENFIGRLKLFMPYRERATRVKLEGYYPQFQVQEILSREYSGRSFPGYEDIDLPFEELETIVRNQKIDWKTALSNCKGIYLITDVSTGLRYVGSAYNEGGIWQRWCEYINSGHGGNVELRKLVQDPSLLYCRANFKFSLLEHRSMQTSTESIIRREGFWKSILLSRTHFGLNKN